MDKRFFLALILTAVVVIATPLLFKTTPVPSKTGADSAVTHRDSTVAPNAVPLISEDTARQPAVLPAQPTRAESLATAAPIVPETTVVSTTVADYRFSNIGAMPLTVDVKAYKALDGTKQNVRLASSGGRLLAYRLVLPADTISLSRTTFQLEKTQAAGADLLTYRATVKGIDVAIRYAFVPDSYLVRVSGEVKQAAGISGYVAIDMPNSLRSAEADSLDDQNHLAYAYKPQRESARGIPFNKVDPGERRIEAGPITWVAAKNKYFIVGLLTPDGDTPFSEVTVTGGVRTGRRATQAEGVAVEPIRNGAFAFELYTGPQEWRRLLALGRDFENSNPYGGFMQGV
ncbi:MAG TPA: membrane protein insertase YidC, partial [Pyrinomonadaceae bacterium]|nr:membrane protein insertase YidC [Pyrinomonadaceae bacterium]